jgi:hypothetical protein
LIWEGLHGLAGLAPERAAATEARTPAGGDVIDLEQRRS